MKKKFIGLFLLILNSAFAESHVYKCDSKEIFSGQRLLGISQEVIIDEITSVASFRQKNNSPQANWKNVVDLNSDNARAMSDRFISENSNIVFYRTVTTFIEGGMPVDESTSDGVLVIKIQNTEPRSFLCKLETKQ